MAKRSLSGDGMVRQKKKGQWEGRIAVGHKESGTSKHQIPRPKAHLCNDGD